MSEIAPTTLVRLQASKGKIIQNCDVYIGRRLTMGGWSNYEGSKTLVTSKYANQYKGENAGLLYYYWLMEKEQKSLREEGKKELSGKEIGCWCIGKRKNNEILCHGYAWIYICDGIMPKILQKAIDDDKS